MTGLFRVQRSTELLVVLCKLLPVEFHLIRELLALCSQLVVTKSEVSGQFIASLFKAGCKLPLFLRQPHTVDLVSRLVASTSIIKLNSAQPRVLKKLLRS